MNTTEEMSIMEVGSVTMNLRRCAAAGAMILLALTTSACDSFLDVNTNPNVPQVAPVDITLPAVQATFSNGVLGSWPAKMSAEWMQQLSFNSNTRGFARYDKYEMRPEDSSALWDLAYATILTETKDAIEKSTAKEEWAYVALNKIMHAWTLSVVTDVFGPIPSSEALDPFVGKPKYDEQKAVYAEIQKLIDEAILDLQKPNFPSRIPAINDLLYTGDLTRWVKLAHTLQAQMNLHLLYAPGETPSARAQKVISELALGFQGNIDDADFRYATPTTASGPRAVQPWAVARQVTQYRMSQFYVDQLVARNDPRLAITADRVTQSIPTSGYRGHKNGDPAGPDATFSRVGVYFGQDTASFTWLSYSQAKFMEAEARLVATGAASADAAYREGIRANMEKMRVAAAAITTYLNARPNLATVANPLAEIMREKYVANFLKFETWNDWRRTGYPILTPVTGAMTAGIPQRFPTPTSELIDNNANATGTGIPTGLAGMTTKVWWASTTTGPR
jgi:hypothetical protein